MQLALKRAGYTLLVDGIFGTNTCQALADFCRPTAYAWWIGLPGKKLLPYLRGYVTEEGRTGFFLKIR